MQQNLVKWLFCNKKENGSQQVLLCRKNSAYAEDFDIVLARIQEGQLDRKLQQKYLFKPKQCTTSHDLVRLEDPQGIFITLSAGLGLALILFSCELFSKCHVFRDVTECLYYLYSTVKRFLVNIVS